MNKRTMKRLCFFCLVLSFLLLLPSKPAYAKKLPTFDELFGESALKLSQDEIEKKINILTSMKGDSSCSLDGINPEETSKQIYNVFHPDKTDGAKNWDSSMKKKFEESKTVYQNEILQRYKAVYTQAYNGTDTDISTDNRKFETYSQDLGTYINRFTSTIEGNSLSEEDSQWSTGAANVGLYGHSFTIAAALGYYERIGLKDTESSDEDVLKKKDFNQTVNDYTVGKVIYSYDTSSFKAALQNAIDEYHTDINFLLNVVIGLGALAAVLVCSINFMKLGTTAGNPKLRRHTMVNICVSFGTIIVLGSTRFLAYLAILLFIS